MKIAIDARELRTTTGRYVEKLIDNLQEIDKTNDYLILLKSKDIGSFKATNPRFKPVVCDYKEFTFSEQTGFYKQLKKLKPDLVHFGMVQQPILYKGAVVTTIHDLTTARFNNPSKNFLVFGVKQQIYKKVIKTAAKKSKKIIVPSLFVKNDLVKFAKVSPNKIEVTYEASDVIKDPSQPIKLLQDKDFIMYTGRPTPHKNLTKLIDAFEILQKNNPRLYLVLVGKKDVLYEKHEEYVQKKNIDNIIFTGFVSEGSLKWLYENCQAYIFPSLSEGFGLPGLEAMNYGAPIVSSNATCLPEIYGTAAQYFNPLDLKDITQKINEVLTNEDLRQTLIKSGYTQVKKYSWEKMAKQTLAIYNEVLKQN